jgi:hypothetical protein
VNVHISFSFSKNSLDDSKPLFQNFLMMLFSYFSPTLIFIALMSYKLDFDLFEMTAVQGAVPYILNQIGNVALGKAANLR